MSRATCKSCGAAILWAKTARGAAIPIDPNPCPDGNLEVSFGERGTFATVRQPGSQMHSLARANGTLWRSHFATCPNARLHRRREARP